MCKEWSESAGLPVLLDWAPRYSTVDVNIAPTPTRSKNKQNKTLPKRRDSPDKEAAPVPVGRDVVPLLPVPGHLRPVPLEALPQQVLLRHWFLLGWLGL